MARTPTDIRSLARAHTESNIRQLAQIAARSESDNARVTAIGMLLDRAWGKAPQTHTGENGEGAIKVLVRHIIGGQDILGPLIEHNQLLPIGRSEDE